MEAATCDQRRRYRSPPQGRERLLYAIGNDLFANFRSTGSKSRLDFLEHLCAGEAYTINDAATRLHGAKEVSGKVIALLAAHGQRCFSGSDEWHAHLEALGIAGMKGP